MLGLVERVFKGRFALLCDYALAGRIDPSHRFIMSLDATEKQCNHVDLVLHIGSLSRQDFNHWDQGHHTRLQSNVSKKRKFV